MEHVIEILNNYVDCCATCETFLMGRCGYVDKNISHPMIGEEEYYMMSPEEVQVYFTQLRHQPCETQVNEPTLIKQISEAMDSADIILNEEWLLKSIASLYAVKTKVSLKDDLFRNCFDGTVRSAIETILMKIDLIFLQNHLDIKEYVEMAGLDYDRYTCLSKICPISFIKMYEKKAFRFIKEDEPFCSQAVQPEPSVEVPKLEPTSNLDGEQEKISFKQNPDIPANISAVDELILRFGGWSGKHPITALLINAGYGQWVFGDMWELEGITKEEWAAKHSEDWKQYQYDRFDELRTEISSEIKKRVGDELELKKYVCGLITPFERYQYYAHILSDIEEVLEARALIDSFSENLFLSSDEYIQPWKKMAEEVRSQFKEKDYSEDEYLLALYKGANEMEKELPSDTTSPEALAFELRKSLPEKLSGVIAGCLLENGATKEYMDYQDMCGMDLVPRVLSSDVASAMNWTEGLVFSYNPKRIIETSQAFYEDEKTGTIGPDTEEAILTGRSATEHFLYLFSSNSIIRYLWAITARLGFEPDLSIRPWTPESSATEEDVQMYQEEFEYPKYKRFVELRDEISHRVKELKSDNCELDNYVFSLLRPLSPICEYIHPVASDWHHTNGAKAVVLFATAREYDIDKFNDMWREATRHIISTSELNSGSSSILPDIFSTSYQECADGTRIPNNDSDAAKVSAIIESLHSYASVIEGALLKNGVKNDLMYYQESSEIILSPKIDDWMVAGYLGWTEAQVGTYIRKYGHRREMREPGQNNASKGNNDGIDHVSFGDITVLPEEFRTPKAVSIWEKAYQNGLIDKNFRFIGKKIELSMFAANLSYALFGKIDWVAIQKWDNYKYYAKSYGDISSKPKEQQSNRIKLILSIF